MFVSILRMIEYSKNNIHKFTISYDHLRQETLQSDGIKKVKKYIEECEDMVYYEYDYILRKMVIHSINCQKAPCNICIEINLKIKPILDKYNSKETINLLD